MRLPDSWQRARFTIGVAVAATVIWALLVTIGQQGWAILWGGFIPARLGVDAPGAPFWLTPLTSAFLHANFVHLAFNLLILVFCGRPTENVIGSGGLAILYLVGAYAAAAGHYFFDPASPIPVVGASGAISAVLGAYALLFGRNRVRVSSPTLATWLNSLWLLAAFIILQLMVALALDGNLRIAIGAHIGGFLAGIALAHPLLLLRYRRA